MDPAFRVHYQTAGAPFFARFLREGWEAVRSHHALCHTFQGRGTSRTLTFSFSSRIDYSDIPRLDKTFFKKATMAWPPAKKQLTIRLDEDVLDWLKRHGKGYQTRINRILRVVMESQPPRTAHR